MVLDSLSTWDSNSQSNQWTQKSFIPDAFLVSCQFHVQCCAEIYDTHASLCQIVANLEHSSFGTEHLQNNAAQCLGPLVGHRSENMMDSCIETAASDSHGHEGMAECAARRECLGFYKRLANPGRGCGTPILSFWFITDDSSILYQDRGTSHHV